MSDLIPRTTSTGTRADGSEFTYEHVDHAAILARWNEMGAEVWMLESGDLNNVIDLARERLDAVLALHPAEDEPSVVEEGFTGPGGTWQEVPVLMCRGCWDPHPCPTVRAIEGDA